jgi:hypothetical protein
MLPPQQQEKQQWAEHFKMGSKGNWGEASQAQFEELIPEGGRGGPHSSAHVPSAGDRWVRVHCCAFGLAWLKNSSLDMC